MISKRFSYLATAFVLALACAGLAAQDPAIAPRFRTPVWFTEGDTGTTRVAAEQQPSALVLTMQLNPQGAHAHRAVPRSGEWFER